MQTLVLAEECCEACVNASVRECTCRCNGRHHGEGVNEKIDMFEEAA